MKKSVILFSHGSLLCGAGRELEAHVQRLRDEYSAQYSAVEIGYLNYSSPSFAEAVAKCDATGAREIIIAPYFLIDGYFVKNGLPKVLDPLRDEHSHIQFLIAKPLCDHPLMADAVLQCAQTAAPPARWRDLLNTAQNFCEHNPQCPLYDSCQLAAPVNRSPNIQTKDSKLETRNSELLLLVHGSPNAASNDDIIRVVEAAARRDEYSSVSIAYMECNSPDIPEAIDELVCKGAKRIVALPYFLHPGNHVANDLPDFLEEAAKRHSGVEFLMTNYLGGEPLLSRVLQLRVAERANQNK